MNRLNERQTFHACVNEGEIHDCGSKLGWLKANAALGLEAPELKDAFAAFLREKL